jgi:hypothetical protein
MRVCAAGDHGHDSGYAQFRAFLDRPFHAIELEDGKQESDIGDRCHWHFFPKFELNPAVLNGDDASSPHYSTRGDIKFLPNAGTQDANEVIGMFPSKGGVIAQNFIGDPSASSHWRRCAPQRLKPFL